MSASNATARPLPEAMSPREESDVLRVLERVLDADIVLPAVGIGVTVTDDTLVPHTDIG